MTLGERARALLNEEQIKFIHTEFGCEPDAFSALDNDALDKLYDAFCDIEVEEIVKADDAGAELSGRGRIVGDIITAIGNEIYRKEILYGRKTHGCYGSRRRRKGTRDNPRAQKKSGCR